MADIAFQWAAFLGGLLISGGLLLAGWRWLRSRKPSATFKPIVVDGAGRHVVPVIAAFTGVRGLPWIAIATNNANPNLVVTATGIECRVILQRSFRFDQIERVDLRIFGATVNVVFTVHGSVLTFIANVGNVELARRVLALLP